jgi:hypothetical protein
MIRVEDVRDPSAVDAVIPVVTPVVLIGGSLALFGLDAGLSPDRGNRCDPDIAGVGRFPTLHSRNSKGAVSR